MKTITIEDHHADYLTKLLSEQRKKTEAHKGTLSPNSAEGRKAGAEIARIDNIVRAIEEPSE